MFPFLHEAGKHCTGPINSDDCHAHQLTSLGALKGVRQRCQTQEAVTGGRHAAIRSWTFASHSCPFVTFPPFPPLFLLN